MPNIIGQFRAHVYNYSTSGCVTATTYLDGQNFWSGTTNKLHAIYSINASLNSPTYKDNSSVAPKSLLSKYFIKY